MKRLYIITGAKGHLGSTIVRYLRRGNDQIRGLILPDEIYANDGKLTYYKGDVTCPETLEPLFAGAEDMETIVIHTAGIVSISGRPDERLYRVNVGGTRNILEQCRRHRVKRLVYVSSVHAIPEQDGVATICEAARFPKERVSGAYAATKAEATQAVMNAAQDGLDAVIVHPSGILGPYDCGNNHLVQMIRLAMTGKLPAGVRGGYDFVDVRDVAKGCLKAAEKGKAGNCYILSNRYFTVQEILDDVSWITGGWKLICLPMGLARAFAPAFCRAARLAHKPPLYTAYALDTLAGNGHFSHDKATAELGYHPRDMMATLRDTIRWLHGQLVPLEPAGVSESF